MRFPPGSSSVRNPTDVSSRNGRQSAGRSAVVELYWLPLGAGGHSVRLNGRAYEAVAARFERRRRMDIYHSALIVDVPAGRFVIEQAPVRDGDGARRGVVAEGPVGTRSAGCLRLFRYEIRCWRGGVIPDVDEAVESPRLLTDDIAVGERLLRLVPRVPTPVWGRNELDAGEMWNSNSFIAWLISSSGLDATTIHPPANGRAPGWGAGVVVSRRSLPAGGNPASRGFDARKAPQRAYGEGTR